MNASSKTTGRARPDPDRCEAKAASDGTGLSKGILFLLAITCAVSVANVYYAQPLLASIAASFAIDPGTVGLVVTLTQAGYAVGLVCIVPLGDLLDRRKLVIGQTFLASVALAAAGIAPTAALFMGGMIVVGLLAVVVQVLVAFAATAAKAAERGRAVGLVTGGVITGILAARFVSGVLADIGGWRTVYLTSAGLMLALSLLLVRALPAAANAPSAESYGAILRSVPRMFLEDRLLRSRAILALLIFASFSTLWTSMVLPLTAPPQSLSHTRIGLFGFAGLAGAVAANGAGRLADRGLGQVTTGRALALLTMSWLPIGLLSHSLVLLAVGVVLLDLAVQAVHVTNQSLMFAARSEAHSRIVGGYMVFYSVGSAVGAIASTTVYSAAGWTGVAILGATFSGLGLLFWAFDRRRSAAIARASLSAPAGSAT